MTCFYECCRCGRKHPGGAETPETCEMIPGDRKNEWVFVCVPACEPEPES